MSKTSKPNQGSSSLDNVLGEDLDQSVKKVYAKPVLTNYGDVRDITLGVTAAIPSESGSSNANPRIKQ